MTDEDAPSGEENHLDDIEDGVGCTEIWERLSESRNEDSDGGRE